MYPWQCLEFTVSGDSSLNIKYTFPTVFIFPGYKNQGLGLHVDIMLFSGMFMLLDNNLNVQLRSQTVYQNYALSMQTDQVCQGQKDNCTD